MTTTQKNLTTAILLMLVLLIIAVGQQSKQPYSLNPDASKVWANIEQSENELRRQYDQLEGQRATLLIGAGVPQDSRSCKADDKGIVVCVRPETAKTEKK